MKFQTYVKRKGSIRGSSRLLVVAMNRVFADLTANLITDLKVQVPLDGIIAAQFCAALKMNNSLKRLEFGSMYLSQESISFILKGLEGNDTLFELDVRGCRIGPASLKALLSILCIKSSVASALQTLLLDANDLDESVAHDLSLLAEPGHNIRRISFRDNQLGDKCASQLASVLSTSRTMDIVDLGRNRISTAGCSALLQILDENRRLQYLALDGNDNIPESQRQAVEQKIMLNRVTLGLSNSEYQHSKEGIQTSAGPRRQISPHSKSILNTLGSIRETCNGLHESLQRHDMVNVHNITGDSSELQEQKELIKSEIGRLEILERDLQRQMRTLIAGEQAVQEKSKALIESERALKQRGSQLESWAAQLAERQRLHKLSGEGVVASAANPVIIRNNASYDHSLAAGKMRKNDMSVQTEVNFAFQAAAENYKHRLNSLEQHEERFKYEENRMAKLNSIWERQMTQLELLEKELLCRAQELIAAEDHVIAKVNETADRQAIIQVKENEIEVQSARLSKLIHEMEVKKAELESKDINLEKSVQAVLSEREKVIRELSILSEREKHVTYREISFVSNVQWGVGESVSFDRESAKSEFVARKSKEAYLEEKESRLQLLQDELAHRDSASKALKTELNELLSQMKRKERELKTMESEQVADLNRRHVQVKSEEAHVLEILALMERTSISPSNSPDREPHVPSSIPVKQRIRALKAAFDQENQARQTAWTHISKLKAVVQHREGLVELELENLKTRSARILVESNDYAEKKAQLEIRETKLAALAEEARQEKAGNRSLVERAKGLLTDMRQVADGLEHAALAITVHYAALAEERAGVDAAVAALAVRQEAVKARDVQVQGREREMGELSVVAEEYSAALAARGEEVRRREVELAAAEKALAILGREVREREREVGERERANGEREKELRSLGEVAQQYSEALEAKERHLRRRERPPTAT